MVETDVDGFHRRTVSLLGKEELTLRQDPIKKYLVEGNNISLICCFRCWFNNSKIEEFKWSVENLTMRNNWTQMMIITNDTYYDVNNTICSNLTFDQISAGSGQSLLINI